MGPLRSLPFEFPSFAMFKKANRNFRRRQDSDADDDEDGASANVASVVTAAVTASPAVKELMNQKPLLPNFNVGVPQTVEDDDPISALNDKMKKKKKKKEDSLSAST